MRRQKEDCLTKVEELGINAFFDKAGFTRCSIGLNNKPGFTKDGITIALEDVWVEEAQ